MSSDRIHVVCAEIASQIPAYMSVHFFHQFPKLYDSVDPCMLIMVIVEEAGQACNDVDWSNIDILHVQATCIIESGLSR